jgi:thiopeptide-type bacteriocin biosynthesis protein
VREAANRWFFIRDADPEWRLRLRFHGAPAQLAEKVRPALEAAAAGALADGLIRRMQLDTYEPELARYGGDAGLPIAEGIFHADSIATLALLRGLTPATRADWRWRLTLRGMDLLLSDLGFDVARRLTLLERIRGDFGREFRVDATLERQLGDRFRRERLALEALLAGDPESLPSHARTALAERSARLAPLAAELTKLSRTGRLTASIEDLAASYLHMHANRMLRASAREHELVIYDLLARLYKGVVARAAKSARATKTPGDAG